MATILDAVRRCEDQQLDPAKALSNQFLIAETGTQTVPGMTSVPVHGWTLHHGASVEVTSMRDSKGRLFGLFVGVGVDGNGELIGPDSFTRLNSKSPFFERSFAKYITHIGGRYAILLDTGSKTRVYLDPLAHMATFFNAETRLVASSALLTIDRALEPGDLGGGVADEVSDLPGVLPLGRGPDEDTRLVLGNHMLDLSDFAMTRFWPHKNTIRTVTREKSAPVIDGMVDRARTVLAELLGKRSCILPVKGGDASRVMLAAMGENRWRVAQFYDLDDDTARDTTTAGMLCDRLGFRLDHLDRDLAHEKFGDRRFDRRMRKRLFWLRTSCAVRCTPDIAANVPGLQLKKHLVLQGAGSDILRSDWYHDVADTETAGGSDVTAEISAALGRPATEKEVEALLPDYNTWKAGLPKTLHPMIYDFIRMELHQPAMAVSLYTSPDNASVTLFSDRGLIEQALKLSVEDRVGTDMTAAFIERADAEVAELPWSDHLAQVEEDRSSDPVPFPKVG